MRQIKSFIISLSLTAALAVPAYAAPCGNSGGGFNAWKAAFAAEAKAAGVKQRGLDALASASYANSTIAADRNQKGVRYALNDFIRIRLGSLDGFAASARKRKARNAGFYQSLENRYGVPAGVLLAIHGMETGFGRNMGNSAVVPAILTLAYDCRRSSLFTPHAIGALMLVDRGTITANTKGAKHGELGHTQFLPGNALRYGVDANGDGRVDLYNEADALASTANYLRQKGWKPGAGYQEGQTNVRVLNQWNAATVYQKAIALAAARIDG